MLLGSRKRDEDMQVEMFVEVAFSNIILQINVSYRRPTHENVVPGGRRDAYVRAVRRGGVGTVVPQYDDPHISLTRTSQKVGYF